MQQYFFKPMTNLNPTQLVCPHCWNQFYGDEALYISTHPELYGDDVLGETENKRFSVQECSKDRTGIIRDPKGSVVRERACPRCHLQIPPELLVSRGRILSVVGAPQAGKTYFLTSMLHMLRNELPTNFALLLRDSDSHEIRIFHEYENTLFAPPAPSSLVQLKKTETVGRMYNNVVFKGNTESVQLPKPIMFSISPTISNPDKRIKQGSFTPIVLYDNAGESFDFLQERNVSSLATQHLSRSEAIFFCFDPLLDGNVRERLKPNSTDPQLTSVERTARQEAFLIELLNRIRRQRGLANNRLIDVPLLICVQKYDAWKALLPFETIVDKNGTTLSTVDASSIVYFEQKGIAGLDLEELNRIGLLVRAFLSDVAPTFVELAESNFTKVRYFPVSALGTSPVLDDSGNTNNKANPFKIRAGKIAPFRVTHPFLWLLYNWQLIRAINRRSKPQSVAEANIAWDDRNKKIRCVLPSRRVLMLDAEYSEMLIIDPYSGKQVWIPKIEAPKEQGESPNVSPPKSLKDLSFKPPPPPEPPKKGWFKK